jgi:cell division protein FtsB
MGKQEEEIVELKKKINGSQKMEKQGFEGVSKDRENDQLKEEIMEKKLQIKNLKEKEKLLEQLLNESKRN